MQTFYSHISYKNSNCLNGFTLCVVTGMALQPARIFVRHTNDVIHERPVCLARFPYTANMFITGILLVKQFLKDIKCPMYFLEVIGSNLGCVVLLFQ